jgi:selenocysteine lyase/cysteine desulfurase
VPKLEPAPDGVPERIETGTLNHEGIAGTAAAVEFLASIADGSGREGAGTGGSRREQLATSYELLHAEGDRLLARLWGGLSAIPGVTLYGPPPGRPRTSTLAFAVAGRRAHDVARALADRAVFVSSGDFYAATVMLRLGHAEDGLVRAGCACYTTDEEVDRLVSGIAGLQ